MDTILEKIIEAMLSNVSGPETLIMALMGIIIWFLHKDRKRLQDELDKKDERLTKIIDDYYKGNLTLADALNSLKILLFEIKAKL